MTAPARAALLGVVGLGLVLVATPLVTGLFGKAVAVDRFNDDVGPLFSDRSLDRTEADVATLRAVGDELDEDALPTLAAATGRTDAELDQDLATELPAFSLGRSHLDASLARVDGVTRHLRAEQANFHREDAIPTSFLPMVAVPALFVASGSALAGLAVLAVTGRSPRALPAVLTGVALAVAVVPLAWTIPAKAQAVDDLTGALRSSLSEAAVGQHRTDLAEARAMVDELRSDGLPAFADDLGLTDAQFTDLVATQFPAIDAGLPRLDAILDRLDAVVATAEANVDRFRHADAIPTAGTPTVLLPWLLVVPAAIAAVLAAGTTATTWRHHLSSPEPPAGGP